MALEEFPLTLPRNAFGPRDTARAGDLWRLCQDAAVLGSSRRGWPPERYRDASCAFVVRSMTAVHDQPTVFGETLQARTWVSSFLRSTLSDRQVRIDGPNGRVTAATQRWVHVRLPDLKPGPACADLRESFAVHTIESDGNIMFPTHTPDEGQEHAWTFAAWYTWMDPLAHANHPAYIDWSDEATSRLMARAGLDPHTLIPRAETVMWHSGVLAPETVTVHTKRLGFTDDGVVLHHRFTAGDGRACAEATIVRSVQGGDADLLRRFTS